MADPLANPITFFGFPPEIRRVIYTTNAIESIYLALMKAQERWSMPIREWPPALYHFSVAFPGPSTAVNEAAIYTLRTLAAIVPNGHRSSAGRVSSTNPRRPVRRACRLPKTSR